MVRLITHNLLACHVKGCTTNNFPLVFQDVQVELQEAEFNPDFVRNMLPRLQWDALVNAAKQVRAEALSRSQREAYGPVEIGDTSLPTEQPEMMDDDLLQKLHHVLMEVRSTFTAILQGFL